MSTKAKGSNAERDIIHKLWAEGFAAIRSAGSGSMRYPSPDILASKNGRILAIECKITKNNSKYFEKQEIEDLKVFSEIFNAEATIAVKFKGHDWHFLSIDDLKETDRLFVVDIGIAKQKGRVFEEFVRVPII